MTSTPKPSTQSAEKAQLAEAEVSRLIKTFASAHLKLIGAMRKWLRERVPSANELVYEYKGWFVLSYSPNERGYEGVLAIRASAEGVSLYFNQGKALPDPGKLLKGSAKLVRFIDVESASTLASPAVMSLVNEAIARSPTPFARTGRGSVILRSVGDKKRARPPRA